MVEERDVGGPLCVITVRVMILFPIPVLEPMRLDLLQETLLAPLHLVGMFSVRGREFISTALINPRCATWLATNKRHGGYECRILTTWHCYTGTVSRCCLLESHLPLSLTAVSWSTCSTQQNTVRICLVKPLKHACNVTFCRVVILTSSPPCGCASEAPGCASEAPGCAGGGGGTEP